MFIVCVLIGIAVLTGIYLDVNKKINLMNKIVMSLFLIIVPHISLLIYFCTLYGTQEKVSVVYQDIIIFEGIIFIAYLWGKVNFFPYYKTHLAKNRIRILLGGRQLVFYGLYTLFIQSIFCNYFYSNIMKHFEISNNIYILDIIITVLFTLTLIGNGMLRVLCTSRRLNIMKRIIIGWMVFIPIVNIFAMIYACNLARDEYEHECYKVNIEKTRVDSEICKTNYPLVLIHGVGFRDFKYVNYWGRIPKELIRQGATVYYGNQEAFGTVQHNANDIKEKILNIIKETGCEKVNIIAHSKGGLDARYMVSKLEMASYVASITMMSSPHKGVKFVDIACHMPDMIYRGISNAFNKYFKLIGDNNPDFYTATKQFSTYNSKIFNEEVKDVVEIYYQSYATVMKNLFSDYILSIPYVLVKITEGDNDGLVSTDSAKWGEFRGVIENNKHRRGISHGDIIDLRRDDYKAFDVIEKYVEIVSELKERGY